MKISLAQQIQAVEGAARGKWGGREQLEAALSTLKWVERHQAELRVLGEFPRAEIRVLTPSDHGSLAIPYGDEVKRIAAHIFESVHHGVPITDDAWADAATRSAYLAMADMAIQLLDGMRAQRKASAVSAIGQGADEGEK